MYPPQAASLPPLLGIERDLFRCSHLVEEVEPAVVGCSVVVPLSPATVLQSRQVCRGKTGPFSRRIAHDQRQLPSELRFGGANPAHQVVRLETEYW